MQIYVSNRLIWTMNSIQLRYTVHKLLEDHVIYDGIFFFGIAAKILTNVDFDEKKRIDKKNMIN